MSKHNISLIFDVCIIFTHKLQPGMDVLKHEETKPFFALPYLHDIMY